MPNDRIIVGQNITKKFGGLVAVDHFSFSVQAKEIVGLIGPNGAGKTTLFNCILGVYRDYEGQFVFKGESIDNLPSNERCKAGIGRTYQVPKPFLGFTVYENVLTGASFGTSKSDVKPGERTLEELDYFNLLDKKDQKAAKLNLGEKKRLEIARALSTNPALLLMDESVAGLTETETDQLVDQIKSIPRERDLAVVFVEHVMEAVMKVSHKILVMNYGEKLAEGEPEQVRHNKEVIEAYLGEEQDAGVN